MNTGSRILELRKQNKWSQTDLGKKVGVSREIIGRYERDEVSPSIDIAKKIANALDVTLDYLTGEDKRPDLDKDVLKLVRDIEELGPDIKEKLLYLANAVIRDYKTRQAYIQ